MQYDKTITVRNRTGLHARPAAVFVQKANKYQSDIFVAKDDQKVDGKSIMGILMLAAEKGSEVTISAKGEDAKEAVEELCGLLQGDIGSESLTSNKEKDTK